MRSSLGASVSGGKLSPTVGASGSITGGAGIRTEDGEQSGVLELSGSGLLSLSGAVTAADAATGGRATQSLGSLLGSTGGDFGGEVSVRIEAPTDDSEDAILDAFQDAALGGTASLRKHYDEHTPTEAFWAKHNRALKQAAAKADAEAKKGAAR